MKKSLLSAGFMIALLGVTGCKKNDDATPQVDTQLNDQIISAFAVNIANAKYTTLADRTNTLYEKVTALENNHTDENLAACQTAWRNTREVWEQSEALLFGPVETDNVDPRIDTWPVNFTDLDAQLDSGNPFTDDYVNNLEDALKGFHPIEYIIFGKDGDQAAADLTDRQLEYLNALALNVKTLTTDLSTQWNTSSSSDFYASFIASGKGGTVYTTQQAALEQMVTAMADICDEVGNSKIKDPYDQQDPSVEESPFSKNSMTDFINNIQGVQNVYLGKFKTDGVGLEDLVKKYNLSLDSEIKTKIASALTAMNNVSEPFGDAILNQHVQIQNAMTALNDLQETLESQLLPFVHQHSK